MKDGVLHVKATALDPQSWQALPRGRWTVRAGLLQGKNLKLVSASRCDAHHKVWRVYQSSQGLMCVLRQLEREDDRPHASSSQSGGFSKNI